MAFSALLSWETPTTPLRMRMVRIYGRQVNGLLNKNKIEERVCTYNNWVNESTPALFIVEKCQNERDSGGTKKDEN